MDALPGPEEIVTWPGLEDALKGVKGELAAYRPESRTRLSNTEVHRVVLQCINCAMA